MVRWYYRFRSLGNPCVTAENPSRETIEKLYTVKVVIPHHHHLLDPSFLRFSVYCYEITLF